jgi:hypothetical protein
MATSYHAARPDPAGAGRKTDFAQNMPQRHLLHKYTKQGFEMVSEAFGMQSSRNNMQFLGKSIGT